MYRIVNSIFLLTALGCCAVSAEAQNATSATTATPTLAVYRCGGAGPITIDYTHGTVTDDVLGQPVPATITASSISWSYDYTTEEYSLKAGNQMVPHHFNFVIDLSLNALNGVVACAKQS